MTYEILKQQEIENDVFITLHFSFEVTSGIFEDTTTLRFDKGEDYNEKILNYLQEYQTSLG